MNKRHWKTHARMLKKHATVWIFFLMLGILFFLDVSTKDRVFSPFENRYLEQAPIFSTKALFNGSYTEQYEIYVADQFVFRNQWIRLKADLENLLQKKENNDIVFGKDGFLFHKYIHLEKQYKKNTELLQAFIQSHPNENIYVCLAPNSYELLSDKTPYGLYNLPQRPWIDWFEDQMPPKTHRIDVYGSLKAHQEEYIYYKTDHHWTTTGAYYAYAEIAQSMGFRPALLSSYKPSRISDFHGSFYRSVSPEKEYVDEIWYAPRLDQNLDIYVNKQPVDSLYDLSYAEKKDKYALFLHNNPGKISIQKTQARDQDAPSLLVLKDSYANSMVPFLTKHFSHIEVIDLRYYNQNIEELLEENFDYILFCYNFISFSQDKNLLKLSLMSQ